MFKKNSSVLVSHAETSENLSHSLRERGLTIKPRLVLTIRRLWINHKILHHLHIIPFIFLHFCEGLILPLKYSKMILSQIHLSQVYIPINGIDI